MIPFLSEKSQTDQVQIDVLEHSDVSAADTLSAETISRFCCKPQHTWRILFDLMHQLQGVDLQKFGVTLGLHDLKTKLNVPLIEFWEKNLLFGLKQELSNGNLRCFYQPVVPTTSSHKDEGYELLVRLVDGDFEVSATELFGTAVNRSMLLDIQSLSWIACLRGLKRLAKDRLGFVNLNPELFFRGLTDWSAVANEIEDSISKDRVVVEILESDKPYDRSELRQFAEECREQGYKIALDDWGLQAHCFDILNIVRPDFIKLEMEIVRGCHQDQFRRMMITGLIDLCKSLNIAIVLEGIENSEDWDWAQTTGANLFQGYFIGRPSIMPMEPHGRSLFTRGPHLVPHSAAKFESSATIGS